MVRYNMDKICKIINGQFSWILEVDGYTIPFNGSSNAEYFEELYSSLDYTIVKEDRYNR
jgi:hypothetical protein